MDPELSCPVAQFTGAWIELRVERASVPRLRQVQNLPNFPAFLRGLRYNTPVTDDRFKNRRHFICLIRKHGFELISSAGFKSRFLPIIAPLT